MRLKQNRLKTFYHRTAIPKKTGEGSSYTEYGEAVAFRAEEWPAGGKVQSERYGIRLPDIRNIRIEGKYKEWQSLDGILRYSVDHGPEFAVNDGICLHVSADSQPDYRVVAVYSYRFLTLEVEKI